MKKSAFSLIAIAMLSVAAIFGFTAWKAECLRAANGNTNPCNVHVQKGKLAPTSGCNS